MMKTENQICSLESAKKLKELGVEQKSLWYWVKTDLDVDTDKFQLVINSKGYVHYGINVKVPNYGYGMDGSYGWRSIEEEYSAFTVAELGEMLPYYLKRDADMGISFSIETKGIHISKISGAIPKWLIEYGNIYQSDSNLTETFAKMLIYLLENKLMEKEKRQAILSLVIERESELREKIKVYIRKNVATQTASSLQIFMEDIDKIFTGKEEK